MDIKLPIKHLTGVILAGGKSTRFGFDKAQAIYEGTSFLDRTLKKMTSIFKEVCIITNTPEKYCFYSIPILTDLAPFRGPLGGILTALHSVKTEGIFVVPCDMPLLSQKIILNLLRQDKGSPLVVYTHKNSEEGHPIIEPLCAIYRVSLLPLLQSRLNKGRLDLYSLCDTGINVQKIPLKKNQTKNFMNINTQKQLSVLEGRSQ